MPRLASAQATKPLFEEIPPSASGITWVHDNAMSPKRYLPETMGPGVAFLDYDNDGWMDIYLVNSGAGDFYKPKTPLRNALYKNNRDGTFTDVTEKAGVAGGRRSAWACAVGDYDNDGYPDLFVTAYGRCMLYHNNGNGTFTDVTEKAGLATRRAGRPAPCGSTTTTTAASICSSAASSSSRSTDNVFCGDNKLGKRFYCIPRVFKPTPSLLFHNNGDGTFTEVSAGTDIAARPRQGPRRRRHRHQQRRPDGSVRRQRHRAELPLREPRQGQVGGDRARRRRSASAPTASRARAWASMRPTSTATAGRICSSPTSIRRCSRSTRTTATSRSPTSPHAHGVAQATRLLSGWGLKFFDYDNDGHVDLLLANGHPDDMIESYSQQVQYKEPLLLFHHDGRQAANVSAQAGPVFDEDVPGARPGRRRLRQRRPARRPDRQQRRARRCCCKNNAGDGNHWLGVQLQGTTCNRDAIGATITWSAGGVKRSRFKTDGGSYLSSHDPREVLGIGAGRQARLGRDRVAAAERAASSASPTCRSTATSPSSKAKGKSRVEGGDHGVGAHD